VLSEDIPSFSNRGILLLFRVGLLQTLVAYLVTGGGSSRGCGGNGDGDGGGGHNGNKGGNPRMRRRRRRMRN